MSFVRRIIVFLALIATTTSAWAYLPIRLSFIGSADVAMGTRFGDTEVGGLSGIDYDPRHARYGPSAIIAAKTVRCVSMIW